MRFLIQCAFFGYICCAVVALAPWTLPSIDLFSNFYVHLALFGAFGFFICKLYQWPRLGLLVFVCAALCFTKGFVSYPYQEPSSTSLQSAGANTAPFGASTPLKFMSLNTQLGSTPSSHRDKVVAALLHHQADILFLQEIGLRHWQKLSSLSALKNKWPHQLYCPRQTCRVAILSNRPLNDVKIDAFQTTGLPIISAKIKWKEQIITIANIHFARPHLWQRGQNEQFAELGRWAKKQAGPLFIAGDFNASVSSSPIHRLLIQTQLIPLGRAQTTWPSIIPSFLKVLRLGIDQAFVSKNDFAFVSKTVGETVGSDHLPIMFTVTPKQRPSP